MSDPPPSIGGVALRILGIDPGSRVTGYAVVTATDERATRVSYVECGVLVADAEAPLERRLGEMARGIQEVIQEFEPDAVAMEDVFYQHNARAAAALAQARGAAMAACDLAGLRVYAYPPALIKRAVTGRGRATKRQVARTVKLLVGLSKEPRADAADALAVAIAHAHVRRDRGGRPS